MAALPFERVGVGGVGATVWFAAPRSGGSTFRRAGNASLKAVRGCPRAASGCEVYPRRAVPPFSLALCSPPCGSALLPREVGSCGGCRLPASYFCFAGCLVSAQGAGEWRGAGRGPEALVSSAAGLWALRAGPGQVLWRAGRGCWCLCLQGSPTCTRGRAGFSLEG